MVTETWAHYRASVIASLTIVNSQASQTVQGRWMFSKTTTRAAEPGRADYWSFIRNVKVESALDSTEGRERGGVSVGSDQVQTSLPVPLEAVLCTQELILRPARQPDFEALSGALIKLAQIL